MSRPRKSLVRARKTPRQDRSTMLVADVLEAAARVLAREGARRFTTVRVAAEAGVSVGSLYQYFPNKESILFRLQADEWEDTFGLLDEILGAPGTPPLARLRKAVIVFVRSEQQEAALRSALDDAGALFRDAPEARAHFARCTRRIDALVAEARPDLPAKRRAFATEFVLVTMASVAEPITAKKRTRAEIESWATSLADVLCGFLAGLDA